MTSTLTKKNGLMRLKFEYEDVPILDMRRPVKDEEEFDGIFKDLKHKIFGR